MHTTVEASIATTIFGYMIPGFRRSNPEVSIEEVILSNLNAKYRSKTQWAHEFNTEP